MGWVQLGGDWFDLDENDDYLDALRRLRAGDASGAVLPAMVLHEDESPSGWWLMPSGDLQWSLNTRPTT